MLSETCFDVDLQLFRDLGFMMKAAGRVSHSIFCCSFMFARNNKQRIKIMVCSLQKSCAGTAYIECEKLFNILKHNDPKNFAEIEKTKTEPRIINDSETSTLAPRDIYDRNINLENVHIKTFPKKLVNLLEKKRKRFSTPSQQGRGFWYFVEKLWFGNSWCQSLLQNIRFHERWIRAKVSHWDQILRIWGFQ